MNHRMDGDVTKSVFDVQPTGFRSTGLIERALNDEALQHRRGPAFKR